MEGSRAEISTPALEGQPNIQLNPSLLNQQEAEWLYRTKKGRGTATFLDLCTATLADFRGKTHAIDGMTGREMHGM